MQVHEALDRFGVDYPRQSLVVELRFFGGLYRSSRKFVVMSLRPVIGNARGGVEMSLDAAR